MRGKEGMQTEGNIQKKETMGKEGTIEEKERKGKEKEWWSGKKRAVRNMREKVSKRS